MSFRFHLFLPFGRPSALLSAVCLLGVFLFPAGGAAEEKAAPAVESSADTSTNASTPTSSSPAPSAAVPRPWFSLADVENKARSLADKPFVNPDGQVPEFLLNLSYDQWRKLRFRPDHALWRGEDLPFEGQFFHPGLFYNRLVTLNIVEGPVPARLPFSADMFEYGDEALAAKVRDTPLDFAGFRLHFPIKNGKYKDEVAVFLGATYFRAVTANSQYGLSGRGLAIDTALPSGEEFPYFREFWLVKPAPDAEAITLYALMDTPSLTGAYRFVITPGDRTIMDVRCTLFARKGAERPAKIGLGALTSMFLYGESGNGRPGDYRPEVHDSDGLLFRDNEEHWFWSPLNNPRRLAVNSFRLDSPRGFGLMQRDAAFDHYLDLEARYDRRPSLWVEPRDDWGPGRLELIEIPSEEEIHDNMVAFWVPDPPLPEAADGTPLPDGERAYPDTMRYAYRLYWMEPGASPHALGRAVSTRTSRDKDGDTLRFFIDFEGRELNALPADIGLSSRIETPDTVPVLEKQLIKNPATGGWRLVFQIRPPKEEGVMQSLKAAREGASSIRLRASLLRGENLPDPLTETWVYDLQL